jgi:FlaG/FlaF family flagellin (archaellin)
MLTALTHCADGIWGIIFRTTLRNVMAPRRRRPLGPKGQLTVTLFLYALFAAFVIGAVAAHAAAAQSSYVQAHGVRDNATVLNVDNTSSTYKGSTTWSAEVTVQLQQPVNGTTTSVVHVPYEDNSNDGDTITVLVDPGDPGYSELPGSANATNASGIVLLVFSVLMLLVAMLATRRTIRLFRQRRAAPGFAHPGSPPARF